VLAQHNRDSHPRPAQALPEATVLRAVGSATYAGFSAELVVGSGFVLSGVPTTVAKYIVPLAVGTE